MPPWIAVLVLGREFLITGLRSVAATEGFTIQARELGKLKMVVQIVAIVATIFAHRWYEWNWFGFIVGVESDCAHGHLVHAGGDRCCRRWITSWPSGAGWTARRVRSLRRAFPAKPGAASAKPLPIGS